MNAGDSEFDETGRSFRFAPTLFARLLEVAVGPGFPQCAFAVEFLFQTAKCLFNGLAFFQFNFRQIISRSSLWVPSGGMIGTVRQPVKAYCVTALRPPCSVAANGASIQ